jgi:hypothetical protein
MPGGFIATDRTEYGLPADVIKGTFPTSGTYDVYPVSLSSGNKYVAFTGNMVEDLSLAIIQVTSERLLTLLMEQKRVPG